MARAESKRGQDFERPYLCRRGRGRVWNQQRIACCRRGSEGQPCYHRRTRPVRVDFQGTTELPETFSHPSDSHPGHSILIVDDSAHIRRMVRLYIEQNAD